MTRPKWSDKALPWEAKAERYIRELEPYVDHLEARLETCLRSQADDIEHKRCLTLEAALATERDKVRKLVDLVREAAPLTWCNMGCFPQITEDAAAWEKKAAALLKEVEG